MRAVAMRLLPTKLVSMMISWLMLAQSGLRNVCFGVAVVVDVVVARRDTPNPARVSYFPIRQSADNNEMRATTH